MKERDRYGSGRARPAVHRVWAEDSGGICGGVCVSRGACVRGGVCKIGRRGGSLPRIERGLGKVCEAVRGWGSERHKSR